MPPPNQIFVIILRTTEAADIIYRYWGEGRGAFNKAHYKVVVYGGHMLHICTEYSLIIVRVIVGSRGVVSGNQ